MNSNNNYDINFAKGLVQNYGQNQWKYINQVFAPENILDARCAWFSISDLQNFLNQIQQPNPKGTPPATGVRIYFGAYGNTVPNPDNPDYNQLHTLLIIPTTPTADGLNTDFDATTGSSDFANMSSVSALNHGSLIPPPYNIVGINNMYQQGDLFMAYADNH